MINMGSNGKLATPLTPVTAVKVIGVGGAGLSVVARVAASGAGVFDCVAMHTDAQALLSSPAPRKVQLGRDAANGLGAGGDPAVGHAAARESMAEIAAACGDAPLVILCAGLGGGTGSGAAPFIAQEAKKAGAMVVGLVTMPFSGEGAKRSEQARAALTRLSKHCVAVLIFENDRMAELAPSEAPVAESFAAAGALLAGAVQSVARMVCLPAILPVGLDELMHSFRGADARCHFGFGAASGSDRVREAVEQALRSPLLDGGHVLSEPGNVVVHITGDALLSLAEVQSVLRQLSRYVEDSSQILLGVAADPSNKGELGVIIMAGSLVSGYADYDDDEAASGEEPEAGELLPSAAEGEKPAKSSGKRGKGGKKSGKEQTQEELPLDQAMRGRFKDLDPTMVDGQDLDIPAFIRMRIRLK
jgi:cell division protein FtsZ